MALSRVSAFTRLFSQSTSTPAILRATFKRTFVTANSTQESGNRVQSSAGASPLYKLPYVTELTWQSSRLEFSSNVLFSCLGPLRHLEIGLPQSRIIEMPSIKRIPPYPTHQELPQKNILDDPLPILNRIIEAPLLPNQEKKQAARLIVIRRIKMNKHKLKKLRKKMKYVWAKARLRRETWREKTFLNEKMAQIKAAWKFDAKSHVAQLIRNVRENRGPEPWIKKGMPEAFIKEQMKIREELKKREFLFILDKRTPDTK